MRNSPVLLILSLILIIAVSPAQAQSLPGNSVYFELGGNAIVPSINYERLVARQWYGRVGLSVVTGGTDSHTDTTFVFPLTASWVSSPRSSHHLELGGGVTIATGDRQDLFGSVDDNAKFSSAVATGIVGYRYQKPAGGFLFRATVVPVFADGEVLPWGGLTFGYSW